MLQTQRMTEFVDQGQGGIVALCRGQVGRGTDIQEDIGTDERSARHVGVTGTVELAVVRQGDRVGHRQGHGFDEFHAGHRRHHRQRLPREGLLSLVERRETNAFVVGRRVVSRQRSRKTVGELPRRTQQRRELVAGGIRRQQRIDPVGQGPYARRVLDELDVGRQFDEIDRYPRAVGRALRVDDQKDPVIDQIAVITLPAIE